MRYLICFAVLFSAFSFLMQRTPEQDEEAYQQALAYYDAAINGKVTTLSGVNIYKRKRGSIYYYPGGGDERIACIRCPVDWDYRTQMDELDFVTLSSGQKVAVEIRSKSGKSLMTRQAATREIQYVRDFHRRLIEAQKARDQRDGEQTFLAAFCALILTGLYAVSRLPRRSTPAYKSTQQ